MNSQKKPILVKSHATLSNSVQGAFEIIDTLMIDGQIYLVPSWRDNRSEGTSKPARMLHVAPGTYEAAQDSRAQFKLLDPIPKAVWDGSSKEEGSYREVDPTDVLIALPPSLQH